MKGQTVLNFRVQLAPSSEECPEDCPYLELHSEEKQNTLTKCSVIRFEAEATLVQHTENLRILTFRDLDLGFKLDTGKIRTIKKVEKYLKSAFNEALVNESVQWESGAFRAMHTFLSGELGDGGENAGPNFRAGEESASPRTSLASSFSASSLKKPFRGTLTVNLIGASNLMAKDSNGLSDPYCEMQLDFPSCKKQTSPQPRTIQPDWRSTKPFIFTVSEQSGQITFTIKDHDTCSKDQFLGQCCVKLDELYHMKEKTYHLKLQPHQCDSSGAHVTGELRVKITMEVNEIVESTIMDSELPSLMEKFDASAHANAFTPSPPLLSPISAIDRTSPPSIVEGRSASKSVVRHYTTLALAY